MSTPVATPGLLRLGHRAVCPPILRWFRVAVSGANHIPGTGGVLVAANHRSFLDHFVLASAAPRPMRFLGKVELTRGLLGRVNHFMGMVAVERGAADTAALDLVVDLLRQGEAVGVFPEGTRSPTGELYRFRSGLGRIAAAAQVPVVPAGILGTGEIWPRGSPPSKRRPGRGTVTVRFGEVIGAPEADPRSRRHFTVQVYETVAALCGQPRARGFAPVPLDEREPERALTGSA